MQCVGGARLPLAHGHGIVIAPSDHEVVCEDVEVCSACNRVFDRVREWSLTGICVKSEPDICISSDFQCRTSREEWITQPKDGLVEFGKRRSLGLARDDELPPDGGPKVIAVPTRLSCSRKKR